MPKQEGTSNVRPGRNQTDDAGAERARNSRSTSGAKEPEPMPLSSPLELAIEAERAQLLQAYAVIKCLYEVLLYADDDDAVSHAEAASVAARLIDESVERLDLLRLGPMIEALRRGANYPGSEEKLQAGFQDSARTRQERGGEVKDSARVVYLN